MYYVHRTTTPNLNVLNISANCPIPECLFKLKLL